MDKKWDWLPARMPRVTALIRAERQRLGDAHVKRCWDMGVVQRQPGWFFAWEGGLGVGAPWPEALAIGSEIDAGGVFADKAFVVMAPAAASYGA
jgi:hypothetical protein